MNHIVENYFRIKLYNARAVEKYGNVEKPNFSELKMVISDVKAKTIKPNGSIIEENGNFGPVHLEFDIQLEGYAQRTGKRMFFETAFFKYGEKPRFIAATRKYPISFRHAFSEHDEIRIEYPAAFTLDNAEMPGSLNLDRIIVVHDRVKVCTAARGPGISSGSRGAILAHKPAVPQCTCRSVANLKDESGRAGLIGVGIIQVIEQRLLNIVTLADQQPRAGIG